MRNVIGFLIVLTVSMSARALEAPVVAGNLAVSARITADSEYSPEYAAKFVADGWVPLADTQRDAGHAWCVKGAVPKEHYTLRFAWDAPVTVGEIVYYARTAWYRNECFGECAVYSGDDASPVQVGKLEMRHGPQRITLPQPLRTQCLVLRFGKSYGGYNPGASEIQVFATPPAGEGLYRFMKHQGDVPIPNLDAVDREAFAGLVEDLGTRYGAQYSDYAAHRAAAQGSGVDLVRAQRAALLFDVDRLVVIRRHEIVATHVYTYHYEGFSAGGGLYVASVHADPPELSELVASPEGQILDCDLSYDAKTILFSWRKKQDEGYHVWAIGVDGTGLRQLTDGPWHDYNACWLPDGGIGFLSTRNAQFAYCWHAPVGVLHRMDAGGGNVKRLSANYLNDFTPYVLNDGRLIYTRWEYVDRPAIPIQSLWTLYPDGTHLRGYFGNRVLSPGSFMEARPIPNSTAILCTMTGHNGPTRGAIGLINRVMGDNAQAAITNLTPDSPVHAVNEGDGNTDGVKLYSCPVPLDDFRFLLSAKGPVLVRTMAGRCVSTVLPESDDRMQYFCAQPVRPRPVPPVLASSLETGSPIAAAGEATLYLQDVYAGLSPWVARGEVKRLRVVREMEKAVRIDPDLRAFGFQFPVISCGATYAAKNVLGEVPVNEDGSAYFRVPAGVPIYFLALDGEGRAVQRMRTFVHLMPGEVQGCVGCHESRQQTPEMSAMRTSGDEPKSLEPPEWGRGGFSFSAVVQPVLDRFCVRCHNPAEAPEAVDLSAGKTDFFNVAYDVLAREKQGPTGSPYVNWIPTYNGQEQNILKIAPKTWGSPVSPLAEIIRSGHPDAQGKRRVEMDDASRRGLYAWIDLNVPYYDTSETAYPEKEGCRRLVPEHLEEVLKGVAARRCVECHKNGVPRREWIRITEPECNPFLMAPLAVEQGGSGRCGKAVFAGKTDADYVAILNTFKPILEVLAKRPRMDMPGGKPAPDVCRDRK